MLRLALLRHAKSSWDNPALDDFKRPLNDRGSASAPVMGQLLASLKFTPDAILCSPSQRTIETLRHIAPFLGGHELAVSCDKDLYLASPGTLLDHIRRTSPQAKSVLVVGHNPGLHTLAVKLAVSGDTGQIARLGEKFPTASLAVFSFLTGTWRDFAPENGNLDAFITPKDRA